MNNYTEEYADVMNNTSVDTYVSPLYQAVDILRKVLIPCLLLLGGFGSVATIFVLRHIKDHNSSHHVFLIVLAVADLSVLGSYVLPRFLFYYFHVKTWTLHSATCKLLVWMRIVASELSAWLVTAVTVQRTLAITWPHRIRVMCTVRRTWTVVAALVSAACAVNFHILVMWRVQGNVCDYYPTADYSFFIRYISPWLNLFSSSFLPFVCLLVCDVILSRSLFQASSTTSVSNQAISNAPSVHSDNSRRETARRTTIMILALSISFLFLRLPLPVATVQHLLIREQIDEDPKLFLKMVLLNDIGWILVSIKSAINFFLYCFTGTRFRREFLNWICCRFADPSAGSVGRAGSGSSKGERIKHFDSTQKSRLTQT